MVEEALFISVKHCVQKKWPHCRSRGQRSVELSASSQRGHDIKTIKFWNVRSWLRLTCDFFLLQSSVCATTNYHHFRSKNITPLIPSLNGRRRHSQSCISTLTFRTRLYCNTTLLLISGCFTSDFLIHTNAIPFRFCLSSIYFHHTRS